MRLTLNFSVCTVISDCTFPCDVNTFTHNLARMHLLRLKIHNIWMKFFWSQKIFHLIIKEISTLKSYIKLFLIKLSVDMSDSSFFLDSLSKAKLFPIFSAGNSFLFFSRFWNVRFSGRCHFIVTVFVLEMKKANTAIFNFSVLPHKNKCFW